MNITRQVINDLWPLYVAGDVSTDTRQLVDAFLAQDPEFAGLLREERNERMFQQEIPRLPPDREAKALRRTQKLMRGWDWSLFMAILFSCFAFGRIVADTSWDVSPRNFIVAASIALILWVVFFVRILWVRHKVLKTRLGG